MTVTDWLLGAVLVSYPLLALALRSWVAAQVTRKVQHAYDEKLEQLRGELRLSEERTKAELRAKEHEVGALRDGALGVRAARRALIDQRRIDAVDRLWADVHELGQFKLIAAHMSMLKFDELAKRAPIDGRMREFLTALGGPTLQNAKMPSNADLQRPFLSPLSWSLFLAYRAVLASAFARMKVLESGLSDPEKLVTEEPLRKMLIAALPEKQSFIETAEIGAFYHLLDDMEIKLLDELQRMLAGDEDDEQTVRRAGQIARLAAEVVQSAAPQAEIPKGVRARVRPAGKSA